MLFSRWLPGVTNLQTARDVITYTDPTPPLSVFGRWDQGYWVTDYPKHIPNRALDAKVGSTKMERSFMESAGILDASAKSTVSGCSTILPTCRGSRSSGANRRGPGNPCVMCPTAWTASSR